MKHNIQKMCTHITSHSQRKESVPKTVIIFYCADMYDHPGMLHFILSLWRLWNLRTIFSQIQNEGPPCNCTQR